MANVEFDRVEKVYPGGTVGVADFSMRSTSGAGRRRRPVGRGKSTCSHASRAWWIRGAGGGAHRWARRPTASAAERNIAMVFQTTRSSAPHRARQLEIPALKMRRCGARRRANGIEWAPGCSTSAVLAGFRSSSRRPRQRVASAPWCASQRFLPTSRLPPRRAAAGLGAGESPSCRSAPHDDALRHARQSRR